ncbi:OmpA family protein [Chrysiogenes arsenatis]|uniref:OmpA family protein n=1 Tax=Chrysiogenes arsenatis TaxID=309797 RepID=UPI00041809D6|nr:outer membrane beta-barrel domain-containing protein [Chrysiogenes arsenatis]
MKNSPFTIPVLKTTAMMLFACVVLLPLSARAEIKAGSFELSPFVGYNFFENDKNLKDRPIYGGRIGYNFTKHFALEGVVETIRTRIDDRSIVGAKEGQFRSPMTDVDLTFYHIDALYHFMPDGRFNPFVVAGIGGAHHSPDISSGDMIALNYGVGAKYWLSKNIALRFDLRDHVVTEVFQESYHNLSATMGLVFALGGTSKSAPVQVAQPKTVPAEKVVIVVAETPVPKVEEKVKVLSEEAKGEGKIIILAFEDVHFDFDKATLNNEAKAVLKESIQILKDNPKANVRIAGYTSASGTEAYNQALSERRAKAVEDYLVQEGVVRPGRLSTIGYGQTRPAQYESAPKDIYSKAAKANMRVLFEIIVK